MDDGEKTFFHLLGKANCTWDQIMRAIITDPLFKALNTLAEKKAVWKKVITSGYVLFCFVFANVGPFLIAHRWSGGQREGGKRGQAGETPTCHLEFAQMEPERSSLHDIPYCR